MRALWAGETVTHRGRVVVEGSCEQKLQSDGRLSGTGIAFQKVQSVASESATENFVKAGNSRGRFR
jgi:hypothetical protein